MDKKKEEILFSVTNYNYISVDEFKEAFESSKACKDLMEDFEEREIASIKINNVSFPKNYPTPLIVYENNENVHQIRYNRLMKRLEICSKNYFDNKDYIQNLFQTFAQLKLQEAKTIMLTFLLHDNKGKNKLNIFNENIHTKISDFIYNEGFELSLPVDLTEKYGCKGRYEISKVDTEDESEHIYEILANYIFELNSDNADSNERVNELKKIVNSIPSMYEHYKKNCEEIISL